MAFKFADEKARGERDLQAKKADLEAALAEREGELAELRTQADDAAKALDDTVARAQQEAGNRCFVLQAESFANFRPFAFHG